eukprot:256844-Pelagomonas_calceolata.AAC.4
MSLGWGAMGAGGFVRGHTPHTLGCSYSASGTTTALPVQLPARAWGGKPKEPAPGAGADSSDEELGGSPAPGALPAGSAPAKPVGNKALATPPPSAYPSAGMFAAGQTNDAYEGPMPSSSREECAVLRLMVRICVGARRDEGKWTCKRIHPKKRDSPGFSPNFLPLLQRHQDLDARERDLIEREAKLKKLEEQIKKDGGYRPNNWPVCFPIWHHDIQGEIPDEAKRVVREVYMSWWMPCCPC